MYEVSINNKFAISQLSGNSNNKNVFGTERRFMTLQVFLVLSVLCYKRNIS